MGLFRSSPLLFPPVALPTGTRLLLNFAVEAGVSAVCLPAHASEFYKLTAAEKREGQSRTRSAWLPMKRMVPTSSSVRASTKLSEVTTIAAIGSLLNEISHANRSWKQQRYKPLATISGHGLLAPFEAAHSTYLPREPQELNLFFELYIREDREPFDKSKFSRFLEGILPLKSTAIDKREAQRSEAFEQSVYHEDGSVAEW